MATAAIRANRLHALWAVATVAAPTAVAAALAWQRRWISDDGLVVVRTVRQILAGNGPVYNVGERAEAATSTVWTWLLALAAWTTDLPVPHAAVGFGAVLGCAGIGLAVDGSRRWWRLVISRPEGRPGGTLWPLPAGVLVYLALPPGWDFLTSGLETGLVTCWIGLSWWLLIRLGESASGGVGGGALFAASVWLGLGPLVRPELALATVGFWIAAIAVTRPDVGRSIGAAAIGSVLPLGYELFRMGFYGVLVPLPAIAKEAARFDVGQGLLYVYDFMGPYRVWLPVLVLVVLLVVAALQFELLPGPFALALVPVTCGLLIAGYVIAVGGDHMHGRLLLPALLFALLPVLVVPATRYLTAGVVAIAAWAVVCAIGFRTPYATEGPHRIDQERLLLVDRTKDRHPIDERSFARRGWTELDVGIRRSREADRRELSYPDGKELLGIPLRLSAPTDLAVSWPNPGVLGAFAQLDEHALDPLGLAYPLAAHMEPSRAGQAGQSKLLDPVWMAADYGPAEDTGRIRAAQRALTCGALGERLDAARAPLTWERFWQNVAGAAGRTGIRVPTDPVAAEHRFCRTPDN